MSSSGVKVDLHVHSSFSDQPYSWFLKAAHSAECYTSPKQVHALATARGMDLVTICDHDEIAGALELCAQFSNTFVSEEVSARFPEDGCVMHTIAIDITEAQHLEIQRLRRNIYELVAYLDVESIPFFLCHPLSQVNRRLDPSHIRRCLLMFRTLELRNGTRDVAHESALRRIVGDVTPATLAEWAEEFPCVPWLNRDARYGFVGGSDDHAGLSIARAYTSFTGEASARGLRAALATHSTVPGGGTATPEVLEHNIYGVMAGYVARSGQLGVGAKGDVTRVSDSLTDALERYAGHLEGDRDLGSLLRAGHTDEAQGEMHQLLERVLVRAGQAAFGSMRDAVVAMKPADVADQLGEVIKTIMLGVPAICGARAFAHDRRAARRFEQRLGGTSEPRPARVAIVSDTIDEVNGVTLGLRRLVAQARQDGLQMFLVGPGDGDQVTVDADGVVRIPTLLRHRLREYPQIAFGVPHVPSLLNWLVREEIDLVQCSTPGPMGLGALAAGRLAGARVIGQFHTDLPEYTARLTGDPVVAAMMGKFVGWFYGSCEQVLVPSRSAADRLAELGVPRDKVRMVPRGVDLGLFRPERRTAHAFDRFGLNGEPKVLYVGRLSREKGLDALLDGFRGVAVDVPSARLLMVGEGPYAAALAARSAGEQVIFTGLQTGEALAELVASSDVFVFPSETETFGNAVVEAQAAGLPVVVSDRGAARENVIDGVTGFVVNARDPHAIRTAVSRLLAEPELRQRMSSEAAQFAQRYDLRTSAQRTYELYSEMVASTAAAIV